MRRAGLVSIYAKKPNGSTTRQKEHPLAPDLVCRDFSVDGPDQLWVADFERHEALSNRAVVKGHRLRLVAAGR